MEIFLIIVFGVLNVLLIDNIIRTIYIVRKIKENNELIELLHDGLINKNKELYFSLFIVLFISFVLNSAIILLTAILLIGDLLFKREIEKEAKEYYG